jgi:hypothetical protein
MEMKGMATIDPKAFVTDLLRLRAVSVTLAFYKRQRIFLPFHKSTAVESAAAEKNG